MRTDLTSSTWQRMWLRLRSGFLPGVAFALVAALTGSSSRLSTWLIESDEPSTATALLRWLIHIVIPSFFAALVVFLCLRLSTDNGVDMRRRPGFFFCVLLLATSLATLIGWELAIALKSPSGYGWLSIPVAELLNTWLTILLWGFLFGWLYLLYLQHRDDKMRFGLLLTRRSLLTRQIAQSSLQAVRTQIDPEMVAGILRAVRERYTRDADSAVLLMEHLISYLRLAMNRGRDKTVSMEDAIALSRAYVALCSVEADREMRLTVSVDVKSDHKTAALVFPVIRKMLDATSAICCQRIELLVRKNTRELTIEMTTGSDILSVEVTAALSEAIHHLQCGAVVQTVHCHNAQENRYVVIIESC